MRFAFAGDWHGDFRYAQKAIKYAASQNADYIIHVGDFGIWPKWNGQGDARVPFLTLSETLEKHDLTLIFVEGNHEHHEWLNMQPVDSDGFRRLTQSIWHAPRSLVFELDGVRFMGFGGAVSIDRDLRVPGVDWFPEEVYTYSDCMRAFSKGQVDVLVTHDAPDGVSPVTGNPMGIPAAFHQDLYYGRMMLGAVVNAVEAKHVFHGHFHTRYDELRDLEGLQTWVHGLHMNKNPFTENMSLWNSSDLLKLQESPSV